MQTDHLRALVAVVDTGSFEAAAHTLGVTPSAVSQRIKALERSVGRVVVRRASPCVATAAGETLVRAGRQMALVEADARAELADEGGVRTALPLVVNADSLATWFVPVLHAAAAWDDIALRLEVEDESHSRELLRRGDVVAAVSADARALPGCRVEALGVMRYLPVAAPSLVERHRRGRSVDWARLPVLRFNAKDDLQASVLRERGVDPDAPPMSQVPSSLGFAEAVCAGLGWGLLPTAQADPWLASGEVVRLGRGHRDVVLHWQGWRLASPRTSRLHDAVRDAAAAGLRPVPRHAAYGSV